jgi:hypothetical protein
MTELRAIRFSKETADAIEEWRAALRPVPSTGEAIRFLVDYALKNYPPAKAQADRKAAETKAEKPAKGGKR